MTERTTLYRKLAYVIALAVLLFPLSMLGSPSTASRNAEGELTPNLGSGGVLSDYRARHGLSQGNLGEIDPASETIKLATLGLRGVAVNALWQQANEYKKKEDWGNLTATLEQLSKLQPNFITFWKYQAWNLSYNVSVEFDDYHDRYYYVRRGIEFLKKGEEYNRDNPQMLWELGWFIGQKIGRADEKEQYRRLFRADDTFHPADRAQEDRDNWLVGKEWYLKAERAAEAVGIGRKSPIVFYSSPAKSQMNYAEAIENDGRFDRGLPAWRLAGDEWKAFGNMPVEHSTGVILQLNDEAALTAQVEEARQELIALAPDAVERSLAERAANLDENQLAAMETPAEQRTLEQSQLAMQAEAIIKPSSQELAALIESAVPEQAVAAQRAGQKVATLEDRLRKTINYKQTANYDYWALRCEFEQSPAAINARKFCHQGHVAMTEDSDPLAAKALYEQGLREWRKVLDAYPPLMDQNGTTGDDVLGFIEEYQAVLERIDESIPDDFPLWDVIEKFDTFGYLEDELLEHQRRIAQGEVEDAADTSPPPAAPDAADEPATDDQPASEADETSQPADAQPDDAQPDDSPRPADEGE